MYLISISVIYVNFQSLGSKFNFEGYKLTVITMKIEVMDYLFLHQFKFGHHVSQTAANINRVLGEESTCDRIVQCWFQKFRCSDTNHEDQLGRNTCSVKQNATSTGQSTRSNFVSWQCSATCCQNDTAEVHFLGIWVFATSAKFS